jgi:tetratricopeptide (TPR) repeat protein
VPKFASVCSRVRISTGWLLLGVALTGTASIGLGQQSDLPVARELYHQTRYPEALQILLPILNPDADVYELTGKCYYMQCDFEKACEAFQKAVTAAPPNAACHNWLGKSFGQRAEQASPLSAPGLARKAYEQLKQAVELDPQNLEAIDDLFEYSLQAPGFLGGSMERAQALAQRLANLDPVMYHHALGRLAESRKDAAAAEKQLRHCVQLAGQAPDRLADLAQFLARQGRYAESDALFLQAQNLAPQDPTPLFAWAKALIRAQRDLPRARHLLERYLSAPLTADAPPRCEAELWLRKTSGS